MKDGHSFQICKVQPANLNLSNNQQALCNKALDYKGPLLYSYDYSIFVFTLFFYLYFFVCSVQQFRAYEV